MLAVTGLIFITAAVAIALQPSILNQLNLPEIGRAPATVITALLMLLFGLYGLKSFRVSSVETSDLTLQLDTEPEMVKDRMEDLAIKLEWESEEQAREEMRETVKQVLRQQHGYSPEEADKSVENGDWTDNQVAAAFLDTGLKYPYIERIREWLEEEGTLERRIKTSINAVEELHEGEEV
jgi:hypothetical protein